MCWMVAHVRDRTRAIWITIACLAATGATAAWASVALAGTKTGMGLALALTLGPALLYAAIIAPTAFPFSPYIVLVPLSEVLTLPEFGTIGRLLGAATAGALLLYMLRTKRFTDPNRWLAAWLVYFLWAGASLLWAIDASRSWEILSTSLQLFGLYVVVSMFPIRLGQLQTLLFATIAGGVITACYGIYLFSHGISIANRLSLSADNSTGDPNHVAASLILPLALSIYVLLWNRSLFVRALMLCSSGILLVTILWSGSRGAMVGVLALLVFLIVRDPHRRAIGAVCAVLAAIGAVISGPAILGRFSEAAVNGGAGRADIWHVGWVAFTQNWLFGAGYENFAFAYDRAYMQVFQPFYTNWHRAPHNVFLGSAVDLGIIGLGLMMIAWIGQFKMLDFIEDTDSRYGLRLALQASVIALVVVALFSDIMISKYTWLLFMMIALTRNARPESATHA